MQVWHNYGFDRHVMFNSPDAREEQKINCLGFGGDTMHMARLWDSSMTKMAGEGGFSLEALSVKLLGERIEDGVMVRPTGCEGSRRKLREFLSFFGKIPAESGGVGGAETRDQGTSVPRDGNASGHGGRRMAAVRPAKEASVAGQKLLSCQA